ncbi:MAG TPA: 3-hydroxyacyl-ACP dehydratase FabZ family protein [Pirellulales bacterium]|jgi:3-hydroxyacyl-[acyl-carrier-protein] dehydratase|nr:3-hydroxyacyl-ACP dehydratase FabZ family protein [Pirellulales bacterium]
MRWIWIDKFIEFESGKRAQAIKNISLAEEHLHDHFPGAPMMPNSLIVEGLAQTGGLLVGEYNRFEEKVILAKVSKALFHFPAVPGDTLRYTAEIDSITDGGATVTATSHVGQRLQAEAELMFAHLDDGNRSKTLFEPKNFVFTMKLLGVFDVGRASDGGKLVEPPGLAQFKAEGGANQ